MRCPYKEATEGSDIAEDAIHLGRLLLVFAGRVIENGFPRALLRRELLHDEIELLPRSGDIGLQQLLLYDQSREELIRAFVGICEFLE